MQWWVLPGAIHLYPHDNDKRTNLKSGNAMVGFAAVQSISTLVPEQQLNCEFYPAISEQ
jgi:hypothetical protein